jgi:hypothetical protein
MVSTSIPSSGKIMQDWFHITQLLERCISQIHLKCFLCSTILFFYLTRKMNYTFKLIFDGIWHFWVWKRSKKTWRNLLSRLLQITSHVNYSCWRRNVKLQTRVNLLYDLVIVPVWETVPGIRLVTGSFDAEQVCVQQHTQYVLKKPLRFLFNRLDTRQHVSTKLEQTQRVNSSFQNEDKVHINVCPKMGGFINSSARLNSAISALTL